MVRAGHPAAGGDGVTPRLGALASRRHLPSLALVLVLATCAPAWAQELPQWVDYVRVIDGDTVVVRDAAGEELHVRLALIDAPELRGGGSDAFLAAYVAARLLESAPNVVLAVNPDQPVDVFGRTVGWVLIQRGWLLLDLGSLLVSAGLAERWSPPLGPCPLNLEPGVEPCPPSAP